MMELLNNIWNVLITPSELNTKLFILPFNFIEMYLFMTLFLTIFNISSNRKKRIYFVVITSLVIILTNFTIPNPFNVFINYILFPFFLQDSFYKGSKQFIGIFVK